MPTDTILPTDGAADPMDPTPFSQGAATVNDEDPDAQAKQRERKDVKHWLGEIEAARKFDEEARKQYARDRRYANGDRGRFQVDVPIAQSNIDVLQSFLYAKNPDLDCVPSGMTEPPPQKAIEAMVREQMKQQQAQQAQQSAQAKQFVMQEASKPGSPVKALLARMMPGLMGGAGAAAPADPSQPPPDPTAIPTPGAPPPSMSGAPSPVAMGAMPGQPPGMPAQPDPKAQDAAVQAQVAQLMAPYQKKRDDAKQLSETIELVVSDCWEKAKLKATAKLVVASALTVGVGWFKASWLEREGKDPVVEGQIRDMREQLAQINATKREIDDPDCADVDQKKALLEQQMQGLQAKVDIVIARGMVIDFVRAEDMQVSTDVSTLAQYNDAAWLAERVFKKFSQIKADYPGLTDEQFKKITKYWPVKPENTRDRDTGRAESTIEASEADAYTKSGNTAAGDPTLSGAIQVEGMSPSEIPAFGCIWEVWDRTTGNVITLLEGLDAYAKPPEPPQYSSFRGHPFFLVTMGLIDGRRHPRSYIERSASLFDEYNRTRTAYATHRARCIPKTAFDASNYSADEVAKLEKATSVEMVGLKSLIPGTPIGQALSVIAYPPVDPALYDTSVLRSEIEGIWGIQDALRGSVQVSKTATEAEIEQQGGNSRNGYQKDGIDGTLSDFAHYTAEILMQCLTTEDVEEIAGPFALWPQGMNIDDLHSLVSIDIVAGSTGKPDTAAQRQAWATLAPVMQNAIMQIGQLRGSTNEEIADCLEQFVEETIQRSGDRIDANRFMPDPPAIPPPPPQPPPIPLPESALMGPQMMGLTAILTDVRGGVLDPGAAKALIMGCAPHIPNNLIDAMVNGSLPKPGDAPMQLDAAHASTVPPPEPTVPTTTGEPA